MIGELDDSFLGSKGGDAADFLRYIVSSLSIEQTNYILRRDFNEKIYTSRCLWFNR